MTSKLFSACVLTLACTLAGCAVGPEFEAPQPSLPDQWRTPEGVSDAAIEERWWRTFNDPLLDELVEQAAGANLDVQMATLRVAQSRAQRNAAAGARWPALNASAGYQRNRASEFGAGTRIIEVIGPPNPDAIIQALAEPYDLYQAGFDASWELDLWGRIRRTVESASAAAQVSAEDLHAARLSVIAETARTYFELRGAQELLQIVRSDVAASESALEIARWRAAGGLVTQLDVASQQARLAEVGSQAPALEERVRQLMNALALLTAQAPGALDARLGPAQPTPAAPAMVSAGVPSHVARRRPDIRGAEARLHAATAEIGVATADLYPRFTLTGDFVFQSLQAGDLSEWGARQWVIGPSLQLPLFDGGRRRAVVELRNLQQQEAAVNYQRTVLRAWHEIDNALSAHRAEQHRRDELARAVEASRDAYEIARVRYEHGLVNYLVQIDAQRTLLQAQRAYSESNTAIAAQLVGLYKALGGGWEPES